MDDDCGLPWLIVAAVWTFAACAGVVAAVIADRFIPRRVL